MSEAVASRGSPKLLNIVLWGAQVLLAIMFCGAGLMKGTTPIAQLSQAMPWTGAVPVWFVRSIAMVDLAGGLGVLLPSLTRVQPRLTVIAALCCIVLQVLAAGFHISRGEFQMLPVNAVFLALSAFVAWGRGRAAPISSRGA